MSIVTVKRIKNILDGNEPGEGMQTVAGYDNRQHISSPVAVMMHGTYGPRKTYSFSRLGCPGGVAFPRAFFKVEG